MSRDRQKELALALHRKHAAGPAFERLGDLTKTSNRPGFLPHVLTGAVMEAVS